MTPIPSETGKADTDTDQSRTEEQSSSTQKKKKRKKKGKKKQTQEEIEVSSDSDNDEPSRKKGKSNKNIPAPIELDLDQDDGVSETMETSSVGIRSQQVKDAKELRRYYEPPEHVGNETGPNPRGYKCRYCHVTYAKCPSGWSNLYSHRDGSESRPVCVACHLATDLQLPPTYKQRMKAEAEKNTEKNKGSSGTLDKFVSVVKFSVEIFNQVMVIWILLHALPWARMEDTPLRAAFRFGNINAAVRSATWAQRASACLYGDMLKEVVAELRGIPGQFCLIHDVWTTKGKRHAFIGVSVTYIDSDWKFCCRHLTFKLAAWHHYGALLSRPVACFLIKHKLHKKMLAQTTDSGANNNTMAKELADKFSNANDPVSWNPKTMHIRCAAHKLALVVKAGLAHLDVSVGHIKPSTLPGVDIPSIMLNDGDSAVDIQPDSEDSDCAGHAQFQEDTGDEDCLSEADEPPEPEDNRSPQSLIRKAVEPPGGWKPDNVRSAVKKVDKVIRLISLSGPRRDQFKLIMGGGKGIIAGSCHRWNGKHEARKRACDGQKAINQMIAEASDGLYYGELHITANDWASVKALNDVTEIFLQGTLRVEGDKPTAGIILLEYQLIKESLLAKAACSPYKSIQDMIGVMLKKLDGYPREAVNCDAVVLATVLNPSLRLGFFTKYFPDDVNRIEALYKEVFEATNSEVQTDQEPQLDTSINKSQSSSHPYNSFRFNPKPAAQHNTDKTEIQRYLDWDIDGPDESHSMLDWWKEHCKLYPAVSRMARDYLACAGTSCTVERTFSAAADICTTNRGGLGTKTMERAVGCRLWLRSGVIPKGEFEEAFALIANDSASNTKKRYKSKH